MQPQITEDLAYLSARDAAELFRSKQLSPVELMEAVIARAERLESTTNAFADRYFDEARSKAARAEQKFLNPKGRPRTLEGIPLAVKDDTAVRGKRTTHGSRILEQNVDDHTNPSVERLVRAGAIIHARTTCPEFVWAWVTYSRLHGVTRNPWNPAYSPGGSSGGSAASLAAGTTVLATGSDSAGSIRQPASLCGIVGYKPPYGRNPNSPRFAFDVYNHVGPMTRTVEDCILMQNIMSGPHALDHCTVPGKRVPIPPGDVRGLRIAWSMDLGHYEISPCVHRETTRTLVALEEAGAELTQIDAGWATPAIEAAGHYGDLLYSERFRRAVSEHPDLVSDYMPEFARQVQEVTPADLLHAHQLAGETWAQHLGPLFQQFDALICPGTTMQELPAELKAGETVTVNGRERDPHDCTMTILFNMYSRCPVLSVPSGTANSGIPTGIQIVARPYDDVTVFRIGAAVQDLRPWVDRRPGV